MKYFEIVFHSLMSFFVTLFTLCVREIAMLVGFIVNVYSLPARSWNRGILIYNYRHNKKQAKPNPPD